MVWGFTNASLSRKPIRGAVRCCTQNAEISCASRQPQLRRQHCSYTDQDSGRGGRPSMTAIPPEADIAERRHHVR